MPLDGIINALIEMLKKTQQDMFLKAQERAKALWYRQEKLHDFSQLIEEKPGFYQTGWCGRPECEQKLKEHKVSIRCVLQDKTFSRCFNCDEPSKTDVLIAKSY